MNNNLKIDEIKKNPYGKYNDNEIEYILDVLDSENLERKQNPFVNRLVSKNFYLVCSHSPLGICRRNHIF